MIVAMPPFEFFDWACSLEYRDLSVALGTQLWQRDVLASAFACGNYTEASTKSRRSKKQLCRLRVCQVRCMRINKCFRVEAKQVRCFTVVSRMSLNSLNLDTPWSWFECLQVEVQPDCAVYIDLVVALTLLVICLRLLDSKVFCRVYDRALTTR